MDSSSIFLVQLAFTSLLLPLCEGSCHCYRRSALAGGAAVLTGAGCGGLRPAAAARPASKPVEATDRDGNPIRAAAWLAQHGSSTPELCLGLDGEPYFLFIADDGKSVSSTALKAECTHLGCLVQPEPMGGGFACPCHGSKYAADGSVKRGPAPAPLRLARVSTREEDGVLIMSQWDGADEREARAGAQFA